MVGSYSYVRRTIWDTVLRGALLWMMCRGAWRTVVSPHAGAAADAERLTGSYRGQRGLAPRSRGDMVRMQTGRNNDTNITYQSITNCRNLSMENRACRAAWMWQASPSCRGPRPARRACTRFIQPARTAKKGPFSGAWQFGGLRGYRRLRQ